LRSSPTRFSPRRPILEEATLGILNIFSDRNACIPVVRAQQFAPT
jgi:hypothetical protein